MKIKEISRVCLGVPCSWDIYKCPYHECGQDRFGDKLECNKKYFNGAICSQRKYKVIYEIDRDRYEVIERAAFSKELVDEIDVEISKKYLVEGFKQGESLNYILMCNSMRNECK
jgi:hypothetical protein